MEMKLQRQGVMVNISHIKFMALLKRVSFNQIQSEFIVSWLIFLYRRRSSEELENIFIVYWL